MVKFYSSLFIFPIFLLAVRGIEGQAQVAPLPTDTFRTVVPDSIRLDDEIAVGYAMGNQRTMSGSVDKVSEKRMNKGFVSFINIINVFKSMLISVILLVLAGSELIRYEFKL